MRYIDESKGAWKAALDHWVKKEQTLGRGAVITKGVEVYTPNKFWEAATKEIKQIELTPDINYEDADERRTEPMWRSHRRSGPKV